MRHFYFASATLSVVFGFFLASVAIAAEKPTIESAATTVVPSEAQKTTETKTTATQKQTAVESDSKKMVQGATINLQTTVTGNQEQPRVLYILPWQSPQTENVDFETMDNQQKAVFGHVERDELRRELESSENLEKN